MDRASLVAQTVKNAPANAGDASSFPGWEDPLAKEMATHSIILASVDWWAAVHWVAKELDMT